MSDTTELIAELRAGADRSFGLGMDATGRMARRAADALVAQQARAEVAEAKITAALALHTPRRIDGTDITVCSVCGWTPVPCPTVRALSDTPERSES